jgi:hypothetical protein
MITPEEKDTQLNGTPKETASEQSQANNDTNATKHQQVDEEGNQVTPEDVK